MDKPAKAPLAFPATSDLQRSNQMKRESTADNALVANNSMILSYDSSAQFTIAKADDIFDHLLAVAKKVKIPPDVIYAMRKTGRIVTERSKHLLTAAEAAEWKAAIEEYRTLN